jgi:integrase/recombinase XerC/integrase/recombinase XerD
VEVNKIYCGDVVALQKLLGHSSLNTTMIYTHYSTDELQSMYGKVHPLAKKHAEEAQQ